jgi:DNA polymerase, archaea type
VETYIINDKEQVYDFIQWFKEVKLTYEIDGNSIIIQDERFIFKGVDNPFIPKLESPYSNKLIFGKNQTEKIVAVEVVDRDVLLFKDDGSHEKIPNYYWCLTTKYNKGCEKLEGNGFYNYIYKTRDLDQFKQYKSSLYKFQSKFYTISDEIEAAMVYNGITSFKGSKIEDTSILSFDIETSGIHHNNNSKVYLISNTFRKNGKIIRKLFSIDDYINDDKLMIKEWCKWVREMNPSIITGHNVFTFDFPYLSFIGGNLCLGRDMSRIEYKKRPNKIRKDGSQSYEYYNIHCFGRVIIDTWFLALKYDFGRKYDNYKLKYIVEHEGLVKKGRTFYDAGMIKDNWNNLEERTKIKKYSIDDSDDSLSLFDLMMPSYFYSAMSISRNLQQVNNSATGSQLNSILVRAYLQDNHSLPKASEKRDFGGGLSFGIAGIYDNVLSIDVASLYPNIMLEFKVYDPIKDPKGYFLGMLDYFTKERFKNKDLYNTTKDKYYNDLQSAGKIFINSSYGLLGATGLLFNNMECADFITRTGRKIIDFSCLWASGKNSDYWVEIAKHKKDGIK